jgi:DNA primase
MVLLGDKGPMEARRILAMKSVESGKSLFDKIIELQDESDIKTINPELVSSMEQNYSKSPRAKAYMESRGFDEDTTRYFRVGYDPKSDMVLVPIFNPQGEPVGFNGRTVEGKRFRLSKDLPRNEMLFNLHNAKRHGGTAIVCESQFDVMKMHQAGFPNGVCFLGSSISDRQIYLLQRYFNRIIIMTDADPAGRKAGHTLSQKLRGVAIEWAIWEWGVIYPHDAKDVGDMTLEEIRYCIKNAVSDISYRTYRPA